MDRRSNEESIPPPLLTQPSFNNDSSTLPPGSLLQETFRMAAPSPMYAAMIQNSPNMILRDLSNVSPHEPPFTALSSTGGLSRPPDPSAGSFEEHHSFSSSSSSSSPSPPPPLGLGSSYSRIIEISRPHSADPRLQLAPLEENEDLVTSGDPPTERPQFVDLEHFNSPSVILSDEHGISRPIEGLTSHHSMNSSVASHGDFNDKEVSLRNAILNIQKDLQLSSREKAQQVQLLMMSNWRRKIKTNKRIQMSSDHLMHHQPHMPHTSSSITFSQENLSRGLYDEFYRTSNDLRPQPPTSFNPSLVDDETNYDFVTGGQTPGSQEDANVSIPSSAISNEIREYKSALDDPIDFIQTVIAPSLLPEDMSTTYHHHSAKILGCKHYMRGCKIFAPCCYKWFSCRHCHDENNDHSLDRHSVKYVMCLSCFHIQATGPACTNLKGGCGNLFAIYYCPLCKFWDNDSKKKIYHCSQCKICRIGDPDEYFHCHRCNCCLILRMKNNHKCIERNLECDCPICGEYLFTSTSAVIFMPCGHAIHYKCHQEHIRNSYQCPICWKSLGNMKEYFARLDQVLDTHQMPQEYAHMTSLILCNDCENKSKTKYHFLYHKCQHCGSYNTSLMQTIHIDSSSSNSESQNVGSMDSISQASSNGMLTSDLNSPCNSPSDQVRSS